MRTEKEIRALYQKLKEAQGKWVQIDSKTKIRLGEDSSIVNTLRWVLEEGELIDIGI